MARWASGDQRGGDPPTAARPAGPPAGSVQQRLAAWHVAVAVRGTATKVMPVTCLLQLATAKALAQHSALVFGDGTLDLEQQLVIRVIRDRMLQERHLAAGATELLEQQNLISVAPRQAVGAQYCDEFDGTVTDHVAQGIEAGS